MKFIKTDIDGCYLITYKTFHDDRGYFSVPFNRDEFNDGLGYEVNFIQDNMSYSKKNVIRGLHFQTGEFEQAKLVTCTHGRVLDVVVDIRKNSHTFGKVVKLELGLGLERHLFIPRGCAHGFSTLSESAIFQYKVDNPYNKESEDGIIYNDNVLKINWQVEPEKEIVSEKDKELRKFLSL
jgi:dTDP-4-dehydrorhamnose 3,5-epimerase